MDEDDPAVLDRVIRYVYLRDYDDNRSADEGVHSCELASGEGM